MRPIQYPTNVGGLPGLAGGNQAILRSILQPITTIQPISSITTIQPTQPSQRTLIQLSPPPARPTSKEFPVPGLPYSGERFTTTRTLGKGTYGKVELGTLSNGISVARKTFYPRSVDLDQSILREINSLQLLAGAPFIVQLLAINVNLNIGYNLQTEASVLLGYYKSDLHKFNRLVDPESRMAALDKILVCLTIAVAYMHSKSIIHRDIKPANILLQYEYDESTGVLQPGTTAHLADFGLASVECPLGGRGPRTSFVYTCTYRPPEICAWPERGQINGGIEYDANADIWALGASLYEVLTGGIFLINAANCTAGNFSNTSNAGEIDEDSHVLASILRKTNISDLEGKYNNDFYALRQAYVAGNISAHVDILGQLLNVRLTDKRAVDPQLVSRFLVDSLQNCLQVLPNQRRLPTQILSNLDLSFSGTQPLQLNPIQQSDVYFEVMEAVFVIAGLKKSPSIHIVLNAIDLLERYVTNINIDVSEKSYAYYLALAVLNVSGKMLLIYPWNIGKLVGKLGGRNISLNRERSLEVEAMFIQRSKFLLIPCSIEYVWEGIIDAEIATGIVVTVDILRELYDEAANEPTESGELIGGYLTILSPDRVLEICKALSTL